MDELNTASLIGRYPLDPASLSKGDELTMEQVSEILGIQHGPTFEKQNKFRFALLALKSFIEEHTDFTVKTTGQLGIRILTDEEASKHNERWAEISKRSMARRFERNALVDQSNLTQQQLERHQRILIKQGKILASILKTEKELQASMPRQVKGNQTPTADRKVRQDRKRTKSPNSTSRASGSEETPTDLGDSPDTNPAPDGR